MSTNVTLHNGHDVAYFTSGRGRGGCAGAMSYYTAAGEPPGQWAGKGAAAFGLSGQVDPNAIGRLYQHNIGPGGELLVARRRSRAAAEREATAEAAYLAAHPFASAVELAEIRAAERGKDPSQVPYFDLDPGNPAVRAGLRDGAPCNGNGAEVGGVSQDVMGLFSSRAVAVTGELDRLAREYQAVHGKPPSRRTLWLLHQQAGQNTRRSKSAARRTIAGQTGTEEPTGAQRLAAWQAQTAHREVQALSAVHEQVARFAADQHAVRARTVLDDAAKRTAARIAVAEVQIQHAVWSMAQLRFEVHRALPVLTPGADGEAVVTEVAKLAVSGRAGTEVVQVTAPDIADVTSLGVRASDGGSIYRPPNEERYCTLAHLDTEEQILATAKRTVAAARQRARRHGPPSNAPG